MGHWVSTHTFLKPASGVHSLSSQSGCDASRLELDPAESGARRPQARVNPSSKVPRHPSSSCAWLALPPPLTVPRAAAPAPRSNASTARGSAGEVWRLLTPFLGDPAPLQARAPPVHSVPETSIYDPFWGNRLFRIRT